MLTHHYRMIVVPNSSPNIDFKDDRFIVCVKSKPQNNMANKEAVLLIQDFFFKTKGVKASVIIISGHHKPNKMISVTINT